MNTQTNTDCYQQAVIAKYFGKIEKSKNFCELLKNLDYHEKWQYAQVEFKGMYEKLNFFSNILYYRQCFNRDTLEVEMIMEEIKRELLILQRNLAELHYTIQCMTYQQKEYDIFELQEDSPCAVSNISIIDTVSMATTVKFEEESVCSTIVD